MLMSRPVTGCWIWCAELTWPTYDIQVYHTQVYISYLFTGVNYNCSI